MVETDRLHAHVGYQYLRQYALPIKIALQRSDLHYPQRFIYAGGSRSRSGTLRLQFPETPVLGINVDPEPLERNITRVALHKVGRANEVAPHIYGTVDVVIGVDALTLMPTIQSDGIEHVHRGQPDSLYDIPKHFKEMYDVSIHSGKSPSYSVNTHAVVLYRNGNLMLFEAPSKLEVQLKREAVETLSTLQGFIQYIKAFNYIYSGILDPKMKLEKISGGIDLLPLVYLNAVEVLNGVSTENSDFPQALRTGTFIVTVGISPELLNLFGIQKHEAVPNGNFIDVITQRALKGEKLAMGFTQ